jgi:hypothetical protein
MEGSDAVLLYDLEGVIAVCKRLNCAIFEAISSKNKARDFSSLNLLPNEFPSWMEQIGQIDYVVVKKNPSFIHEFSIDIRMFLAF